MTMPAHLLLVDDEPRNLKLLEALLSPLGYVLTRAGGGREAMEAFERERPDLVLLDVIMPGIDGIDVLTRVRAQGQGPYVPVILVTGQADREHRLRGFEAGADEFLEKPIDRALLLTRVRTLLRLKDTSDELTRRNAALERLQREQREMTAFIVHDLKNPLAIMHMNIAWVKPRVEGSGRDVDESLTDALDASARLQTMLEGLLAVARIEDVDTPLRFAPVDLGALLNEVARAYTREGREKRITWCVNAEAGLRVSADRAILYRVLENLVSNALRYTPAEGRIGLSARGGADVEVTVSNTGATIPDEERTSIFEKFRRGKDAQRVRGHAGIGLYFCARAMEAHHGSIAVTQTPEWPTSFVLRFPTA
jgi:two-component system, sensor histidine kinase and response regulator